MKRTWLMIVAGLCIIPACRFNTGNQYKIGGTQLREGDDPYLQTLWQKLNDSPAQQRLRSLKPFPVGVVYYQQRGDNLDSVKKQFRIIHDLGFTALKQVQLKAPENPPDFESQVYHAALDAGLSPWFYGNAGWMRITQKLVDSLGISLTVNRTNMEQIQNDPRMIAYQTRLMRQRIARMNNRPVPGKGKGEPGRNNPYIPERLVPDFAAWLEKQYGSLSVLKEAWNCGYCDKCEFANFMDAARELQGASFDEFGNGIGKINHDFRRFRDAMRFQADLILENYQSMMKMYYEWDSLEPERTGGHQLFENQAMNTWDLEGQAQAAAICGSFYSSIHLTHHFFLMKGEITRPVYMQSRIIADMFKGGWAAVWESTGGPTQWSGYNPVTVDGNRMKQMMLEYIAAGLKGIGIWMWNSRGEGWEVGEYALTDNQGMPTERARIAGQIARVLQHERFDLWDAFDEPLVGVLYSWENEAILGRLSMGGYPLNTAVFETLWDKQFRQYHSQARAGISRALMNNNIPFEYVTERNLEKGLAQRYPVIYLPYILALDQKTLDILLQYVWDGGQLVADFPVLMLDNYGRLNKQIVGSPFEKIFGVQTADYYHTLNAPKKLDGKPVNTQFGNLKITTAKVLKRFSDGTPAVTSNYFGKGKAILLNFEAGRLVFKPGQILLEDMIVYYTLGHIRPPFEVKGPRHTFVFRRSSPDFDHYFVINDGKDARIEISSSVLNYLTATDVLDNQQLKLYGHTVQVNVPANSGVWIKCRKKKS